MQSLDTVSIAILLASLLVLAGILSSLIAMRFGAPLLLVFLVIGMLAGESGPGGIRFNDVEMTYLVGSVALALILFDGGLRTRFQTLRAVRGPAILLATVGVVLTAAIVAPVAVYVAHTDWVEGLLIGSVIASTDAAAVFFLLQSSGLRLPQRVSATLEVESGTNDPVAVFLTMLLVEILAVGSEGAGSIVLTFLRELVIGGAIGFFGGRAVAAVLNRLNLVQGLHAPFVTTSALVIFGLASALHASGFLAVYLAGIIIGNRPMRAHSTVVAFLDAATWLAQIVMFVMLGLLVSPGRLAGSLLPALAVALVLMLVARPIAAFLCLSPFRFTFREKIFISWVGLRGAVGVFLASIPLLVGLPHAAFYFDIAFVVVLVSLLVQGWTLPVAARRLGIALPRIERLPSRIELDLPGQLAQELVGYRVEPKSPYLRRRLIPAWARPTLVVRDERVHPAAEAMQAREGDYIYLLAPPEKARALDRFFMEPPERTKNLDALGDFFLPGTTNLGEVAATYDLKIAAEDAALSLSDDFAAHLKRPARRGDTLPLGSVSLVAHTVVDGRVTVVGLWLDEAPPPPPPKTTTQRIKAWLRQRGV